MLHGPVIHKNKMHTLPQAGKNTDKRQRRQVLSHANKRILEVIIAPKDSNLRTHDPVEAHLMRFSCVPHCGRLQKKTKTYFLLHYTAVLQRIWICQRLVSPGPCLFSHTASPPSSCCATYCIQLPCLNLMG